MCECKNIEIGSYKNQVELKSWWNNSVICVDECLWKEIHFLWDHKIKTTGCCCGHNKTKPMINVIENDHENMIALGYKHWINEHGVTCYEPFSVG